MIFPFGPLPRLGSTLPEFSLTAFRGRGSSKGRSEAPTTSHRPYNLHDHFVPASATKPRITRRNQPVIRVLKRANFDERRFVRFPFTTHQRTVELNKLVRVCWPLAICLLLGEANVCHADTWPEYIARLERADAETKRVRLPQAYHDYAWLLADTEPAAGMRTMEKAISMATNDQKPTFRRDYGIMLLNLAYNKINDRQDNDYQDREARKLAEKALIYNRKLGKAHLLIGDIAYDNQDLHRAKLSWTRGEMLEPQNKIFKKRLAKIETESKVESSFRRDNLAFFDVRFEKSVSESTAAELRKYLERTRKEVGRDFRYYPQHKLVVLAYSQQGFNRIVSGRGPGWWAAFYDGKIRFPVPNSGLEKIKPTIAHEYTHALVHDLSRGWCPKWLNEGLAEYQEAKVRMPNLHLLRQAVKTDQLIPLHELNDALVNSSHMKGALAYQQSFSLVTYLNHKYGFEHVRVVLEQLATRKDIDEAFQAELRISLTELEANWKAWVPELVR